MLVDTAVSSTRTSRAGSNKPCSRIQGRRARATSARYCSAARTDFKVPCASNGDMLPPSGLVAALPSRIKRCTHRPPNSRSPRTARRPRAVMLPRPTRPPARAGPVNRPRHRSLQSKAINALRCPALMNSLPTAALLTPRRVAQKAPAQASRRRGSDQAYPGRRHDVSVNSISYQPHRPNRPCPTPTSRGKSILRRRHLRRHRPYDPPLSHHVIPVHGADAQPSAPDQVTQAVHPSRLGICL
jgi:hypothetical protein